MRAFIVFSPYPGLMVPKSVCMLIHFAFSLDISEEKLVRYYAERWGTILPPEVAILADRGFEKIRADLPNLNKVYMPAFLRAAERGAQFQPDEVSWSRTRARLRYAIETAFARVTSWAYLGDRMDFEKLSLANEVWHWAHG